MSKSRIQRLLIAGMCVAQFWAAQRASGAVSQRSFSPAHSIQALAAQTSAAPRASVQSSQENDELLARTYMATKRYAEAALAYEKLAKSHPKEPTYLNLSGIAHMQNGELKIARTWFQKCTKLEPRFADAYNNIGATYYAEKDYKRALQFYRRAVTLQPGVASYHTNVGYAYFNMKMPVEAEQSFKRALLMDPTIFQQNDRNGSVLQDRSVSDLGQFAYTMASSYAVIGDIPHVVNYLKRALDEGYKDISKVYSDPSFAGVLADPNLQEVLNAIP